MLTTRRGFLKASIGASTLLSLGSGAPTVLRRAALAASPETPDDTVLVVVQLTGGNDGLNTVIPFEDDIYARSRPTLRIPSSHVRPIDSLLGLHPRMPGFHRLYRDGTLSILQGVGYPGSSRNHDAAMRDWHTARPGEDDCQVGWAGRAIEEACRAPEGCSPGVFVGRIDTPLGLNAERAVVPAVSSLEECALKAPTGVGGGQVHLRRMARTVEVNHEGEGGSLLDTLRREVARAHAGSRRVEAMVSVSRSTGAAEYPSFGLAADLRTVAHLIRARLGIRIYFAELGGGGFGGFDSHANQADNHGALLEQLSESVAAFVADLKRDGSLDRVLLATFSEFGRTVAENGRKGTGHGAAAPMFLVGGRLRGGLIGEHPSLADLDGGAMRHHTDVRRVYATLVGRWLGLDSRAVLGQDHDPLEVLRG